jgi:hypothetical protein
MLEMLRWKPIKEVHEDAERALAEMKVRHSPGSALVMVPIVNQQTAILSNPLISYAQKII